MADVHVRSKATIPKCRPRGGGCFRHGLSDTRLETIWVNMRRRCRRQNDDFYHVYGARGISVCLEWDKSSTAFYEWALSNGYEEHLQLDRIDNEKGYGPDNCRFVTHIENQNNRRHHVRIEHGGDKLTIGEWSRKLGISHGTIWNRHEKGWCAAEALGFEPRAKK